MGLRIKEVIKEKSIYNKNMSNTVTGIKNNADIQVMELKEAIEYSIKNYKDYTIFIVGSFYVYGDVIDILKEYKNT